jgi:hypothetical protein
MYLHLAPNLLLFLPDLDALYAFRCSPNFYEIYPWWIHTGLGHSLEQSYSGLEGAPDSTWILLNDNVTESFYNIKQSKTIFFKKFTNLKC